MLSLFSLLSLLAACGGAPTGDDTATTCDETNEACGPGTCDGEGANMLPGADCLACHTPGNFPDDKAARAKEEDEARFWTAAGTVFADPDGTEPLVGATVRVTDADGNVVEMTSNAAGNFYTADPLAFPIVAEVEKDGDIVEMQGEQETGACNGCHACTGAVGTKLVGP